MKWLSADQVNEMHDALLNRYGGEEGGGHRGDGYEGVEAAVQAVKNSYYESVAELAAAYAVYIVQGHVFLDGNKRTGAAAARTFLVLNGFKSSPSNQTLLKLMIELQAKARRGAKTDDLIAWLAKKIS